MERDLIGSAFYGVMYIALLLIQSGVKRGVQHLIHLNRRSPNCLPLLGLLTLSLTYTAVIANLIRRTNG